MKVTLIRNLNQVSQKDTKTAGGKGASLGEMIQAGIPVPAGFVILSNAFDMFVKEADLDVEIAAILDEVDIKEVNTVENASKKIQAIIFSKEIPEYIKAEILKFHKNLDCKFVAVRSSATSEDSASAAWAGQLESYLNTTKETLLENIKKCWASLFTPRAIFYRFKKKLNKDEISVAVVVQKMVDSEESGIAFSVHPIMEDENQIIIEAGFGLGEAVVSGSITPDSYVVDKRGFSVLDINVNEQTKALYKKSKGGNEWKELGEKGKRQVLTEKEVVELSKLVVKIEKHYDFPCDIEWAKEKGKFYIVQSRPITTLNVQKAERTSKSIKEIDLIKKRGPLELSVSYPPQSILLLEYMCTLSYKDNPLYSIINYKPKQVAVILQEKEFEGWVNLRNKPLIGNPEKIKIIDNRSRDFYIHAKKEFKKILDIEKSELSDSYQYIQILNKVNKLNQEMYWHFSLYIDECFITTSEKLTHQLQKTRMLFDNLALNYLWKAVDKLIDVLVTTYKIPKKVAKSATTEEIIDMVKNPNHIDIYNSIIDRPIAWIIINGKFNTIIGKNVHKIKDYLYSQDPSKILEKQSLSNNWIKGSIGHKGCYAGKVQKILPKDYENKNKLETLLKKKEYVLVIPMTSPESVIYFKNAKAFVTDEGGITCHAAIIARELRIPCVIGTKIATRILNNEDEVEVDANQGIVRIIKKKEQ